ncbi:MAG: hypothetical protein ABIG39_07210 [Candidatus Micrarchaeota archaeon]
MGSRKGQAAIEYLMTHGWTILVLTAALIVLYSMGMFNPSRYMRQECYFQPDLHCQSFILTKQESPKYILSFSINNGLGFDILVDGINITTTDIGEVGEFTHVGSCSSGLCSPSSGLVRSGELLNITFPIHQGNALPDKGTLHQIKVSISYRNCKTDPDYRGTVQTCSDGSPHVVSGRIVANVE